MQHLRRSAITARPGWHLSENLVHRSLWTPGSGYRPRRDDPHKRPVLILREGSDARIRRGHPWIFSREVQNLQAHDLHSPSLVNVQSCEGEILGVALFNRNAAIAGRILSQMAFVQIDAAFFAGRLRQSLLYRERLFPEPFYRLAHAEADGLPGLVIDRYGDHVCLQPNAAGLDMLLWPIVDAIEEVLKPKVIILRQDTPGRRRERAQSKREVLTGLYSGPTELRENGVTFVVDLLHGQKTGWYFDHRDHRALLASLVQQTPTVLDLYSYVGAFGVTLAQYGAEEVVCVDSSESALELCRRSAAMNAVGGRVRIVRSDVFDFLQSITTSPDAGQGGEGARYDLIIIDPPNLGSERSHAPGALRFYERLTYLAACVCAAPGYIFVASCTYHVDHTSLIDAVNRALRWAKRSAKLVSIGGQSADHPGHLALPESRYLHSVLLHLE